MLTKTLLAASVAGLATTALAGAPGDNSVYKFSMTATFLGSESLSQAINFSGQKWYIGKPTSTYCPSESVETCPTNTDISAVSKAFSSTSLGLDTIVPGGQAVYVQQDGQVGYTQAHSAAIPAGAVYGTFNYIAPTDGAQMGQLQFDNKDFHACSGGEAGVYQVYADTEGFAQEVCTSIKVNAVSYNGEAAWQYT